METQLLGKPGDFSGAQDAWRDWSAVFRGYAGAVVMTDCSNADDGKPAILQERRSGHKTAQICWKKLMIWASVAALNIVFLAGNSEGLKAWRRLTEKERAEDENTFCLGR